ncbi:DUF2231 domain-containing protein [Massilia sp. H6]|uniref:DUF2231 domain-containing protein n=1 Tax=Massilia sp. H6 TaxID=2970464 RepID=UPI002167F3EF|nr:DUF2231 domain-containing protein [Massilia sp. H6]UVW29596.1 hypothetical protein NRS07_05555 [Massilia sp. H6]
MHNTTIAGKPLHTMLMAAPAVLIPFGFILDALHNATGDEDYAKASFYSIAGGVVGGLAASTVGVAQYVADQPEGQAKHESQVHAVLTGAAMLASVANLILKRSNRQHTTGALVLSAIAAAGALANSVVGNGAHAANGEHAEAGVHTDDDKTRIDHTRGDVEQYVVAGPSALHAPK